MSKIQYIRTTNLDIEVEDSGPTDGYPIILLHGFPDSVRTWNAVTARLIAKGYRVLAPSLRGFGNTKLRSSRYSSNGQTAAFASDLIELTEALALDHFVLVGHDIGASAAMIATPLLAEKVTGLVLLAPNFYGLSKDAPQALEQAQAYWYQWYFCTTVGRDSFTLNPRAFCKELWRLWSPSWDFDDAEFENTAKAFDNPDFIEVIMHFYQHASGEVLGNKTYDEIEHRAKAIPKLNVPTVVLHGDDDACTLPSSSSGQSEYFVGNYVRKILPNVGHFVQREAPDLVAHAISDMVIQALL